MSIDDVEREKIEFTEFYCFLLLDFQFNVVKVNVWVYWEKQKANYP